MGAVPAILSCGEPIQILIFDTKQSRLLQVGHDDAPATLEIAIEPVRHNLAKCLVDAAPQPRRGVQVEPVVR